MKFEPGDLERSYRTEKDSFTHQHEQAFTAIQKKYQLNMLCGAAVAASVVRRYKIKLNSRTRFMKSPEVRFSPRGSGVGGEGRGIKIFTLHTGLFIYCARSFAETCFVNKQAAPPRPRSKLSSNLIKRTISRMSRPLPPALIKGNKFKREKFAHCQRDSALGRGDQVNLDMTQYLSIYNRQNLWTM